MNIAITEGLDLMPPPFADGLDVWSSENGTSGSATYDGAANAAYVPSDADFGGCLELLKTQSIQKLRYTGQTPILPGAYLRIRVRVKAMSGVFPDVRISAYAASSGGAHLAALPQAGPATTLTSYGDVVEIAAIVGSGNRPGVDMVWGSEAVYGHFGIDLVGASGGVIRVDDVIIEDITSAFLRDMLDIVDVRDFGAVGNGTTDDRDAIAAADQAAEGRTVVIPDGTFKVDSSLTISNKVRFEGTLSMPASARLILIRNFDLPTYIDAFGDEVLAFKKGFQALMNFADHDGFDLGGRRIEVTEPIDMQDALNDADYFLIRRVIRNGQFYAQDNAAWDPDQLSSSGTYNPNNPFTLTNVTKASQIQPGSHVTGNGVGREIYVKEVNVAAGTVTLSQALYDPNTTQNYTFTRYKYMLDFMGFESLRRLTFSDVEFQMNGYCSGILLAKEGENMQFKDCFFLKPLHRGITSAGRACQDLHVDRCQFISNEQSVAATDRVSVGFNVNANDAKIRDSRFQRMGTSIVVSGTGHMFTGNHVFQGDDLDNAARTPGIVIANKPTASFITGNYIDNCAIEWTNEYDSTPDYNGEFGFGGLTITGNIFYCSDAAPWFTFIRVKPFGANHFISGFHVNQNTFYANSGNIDRVESFDSNLGAPDYWRFRNITFERNNFNGIGQRTISPVALEFSQSTNAGTWTLDVSEYLPFSGNARTVTSVVTEGEIQNGANNRVNALPYVKVNQGANNDMVQLVWPEACRGTVHVTARVDKPI